VQIGGARAYLIARVHVHPSPKAVVYSAIFCMVLRDRNCKTIRSEGCMSRGSAKTPPSEERRRSAAEELTRLQPS
jgi:hypothetical protein